MPKIYLKKIKYNNTLPESACLCYRGPCYFLDLKNDDCICKNHELMKMCNLEGCMFLGVDNPIKSIKDLPKPKKQKKL